MRSALLPFLAALSALSLIAAPLAAVQITPRVERLDAALDVLLDENARVEVLASGYDWSEGPVWVKPGGYLLFSDVPTNEIYRWREGEGAKVWLKPSGYTSAAPRGGEIGSNGLTLDGDGRLVIAQHGDRRVARLEAPFSAPAPTFTTLADRYEGARFNSPNDVVFSRSGDLYFTDPAYGMEKQWDDPRREIPYAGVFRRTVNGAISLLTKAMTRPNGLAFSPDESRLYVAQSDATAAIWRVFEMRNGMPTDAGRVLLDATTLGKTRAGVPDGLKVDERGNLWASGPGGILVITPQGKHLGTILTGQATSNCAWGDDGRTLYITADMHLMRVRTKVRGAAF